MYREKEQAMKQVLIIDDSRLRSANELLGFWQSPRNIRIAGQAGNGCRRPRAVQRLKPDTVILDIRLPDQSGIELLKTFKEPYPEMTVIMLTNLDDARYRKQCRHLGADHFLNKTIEFEKIVETIFDNPAH
jgi:DNA-binding NarL/FixJ family response regulator